MANFRIIDLPPGPGAPLGTEIAEISNNGMGSFQIAIAVLASARAPNNLGAASFTLGATNYGDILVNFNGAVTITLPSATIRSGVPVSVADVGGFCSGARPITLVPAGAEKIVGLSSIALTGAFSGVTIWPIISGGWYQK